MIEAKFNASDGVISFRMEGHAGSGAPGHDLVCSAASVLVYTAAQIVSIMHHDGKLERKPVLKLDSGDSLIVIRPRSDYYDEALYTLYHSEVGLLLLQNRYPEYVRVIPFGGSE